MMKTEVYLEVYCRPVSSLLVGFNSDTLEAFLVCVVLGLFLWVLAILCGTIVCVDIDKIWIGRTAVLTYPERWDLLDTHFQEWMSNVGKKQRTNVLVQVSGSSLQRSC